MTKFIRKHHWADDIMMFDFTECADNCIRWPWRSAIAGADKLVTELSTYTSCTLYCELTAFYVDMKLLTSGCMLLPIIAASNFYVFVLNVRPGSYFRCLLLKRCGALTGVCVAVVSQPGAHWMKRPSCGSIRIQSHWANVFVGPWLPVVEMVRKMITKSGKSCGIYSKLQVTRGWMTVNLHVLLKIYPAAYSCNLQVIPMFLQFAVSRSDVGCLFVCWDRLKWTTADVLCLIDIKREFFDRKFVWWCLSQHNTGFLHEMYADYQVMMYGLLYYSNWNDSQYADFALFELMKCTYLAIKDSACLHLVHILQNPTSRPTTRSTHDTMVNALKKNFHHFRQANTANRQSSPHVDVLKGMKARAACM